MKASEFQSYFECRIKPLLDEIGVEGIVMAGYITDGEGRVGKFAMASSTPTNPAFEDGLRPLAGALSIWAMPAKEFGPPPTDAPGSGKGSTVPPLGDTG